MWHFLTHFLGNMTWHVVISICVRELESTCCGLWPPRSFISLGSFQTQVIYICAALYTISTGTPASRGHSATAGLLVLLERGQIDKQTDRQTDATKRSIPRRRLYSRRGSRCRLFHCKYLIPFLFHIYTQLEQHFTIKGIQFSHHITYGAGQKFSIVPKSVF